MLTQAAVHICKYSDSFAAYVAAWQGRRAELLDDPYFDPARTGYPYTVAVTLHTSYAELPPTSAWVFDALCGWPPTRFPSTGQPALATGCPCEPAAGAALGSEARCPAACSCRSTTSAWPSLPPGSSAACRSTAWGRRWAGSGSDATAPPPLGPRSRCSASSRLISCVRTPSSTSTSTSSPSARHRAPCDGYPRRSRPPGAVPPGPQPSPPRACGDAQDEGRWSDADAEARAALTEARAARAREGGTGGPVWLWSRRSRPALRLSWVWARYPKPFWPGRRQ